MDVGPVGGANVHCLFYEKAFVFQVKFFLKTIGKRKERGLYRQKGGGYYNKIKSGK